jgi:hypothetical protein
MERSAIRGDFYPRAKDPDCAALHPGYEGKNAPVSRGVFGFSQYRLKI